MFNTTKYFGIGLSRTGTTSLYNAFKMLGFESVHYPRPIQLIKANLYDFMNDTPIPVRFKEMDKRFPNSKFIYTIRDIEGWIKSCSEYFSENKVKLIKPKFDWQMKHRIETYGITEFDEDIFRKVYQEHDESVRRYFRDRPDDLLVMNIVKGDGWEKLMPFIIENTKGKISLPRSNKMVALNDRKRWSVQKRLAKFRKKGKAKTVFPVVDIPDDKGEIRLFSVVKDEILKIPDFFSHYRRMGVDRFFIVDNNSSDGTFEYLIEQDDVHVFRTNESFYFEKEWIESLLKTYGNGNWCVLSDADERFIFPFYEKVGIKEVCSYFDERGYNAVDSLIVDLYADMPMLDAHFLPDKNPLMRFKYFEKNGYVEVKNRRILNNNSGAKAYRGGVNNSVFGRNYQLNKVCLLKVNKDLDLVMNGHHYIKHANLAPIRGAVLHFKFTSDLLNKSKRMKEEEEYYSMHYKKYYKVLSDLPDINLKRDFSYQYEGSQQLIDLEIMVVDEKFSQRYMVN